MTVRKGCGGLEGHSSGKEPLSLCILQNPLWKLHAGCQIWEMQPILVSVSCGTVSSQDHSGFS